MATDNEVLWVVEKMPGLSDWQPQQAVKAWVFRTRAAARAFKVAKHERSKRYNYTLSRAKWGPE